MAEMEKAEKSHEDEMDLLTEPKEFVEEDLENVAGGGCGNGEGCCDGSSQAV